MVCISASGAEKVSLRYWRLQKPNSPKTGEQLLSCVTLALEQLIYI